MFLKRSFIPALCLFVPIIVFYCGYWFNHGPDVIPTGFIQYDNVGYAAYAKQYLDEPSKSLFYSNPFNDSPGYSKIYFQTQTIIISLLMRTGVSAGVSVFVYSIFFAFLSILIAIKLYDSLFPNSPFRNTSLLLLIWGGGLLVIASAMVLPFRHKEGYDLLARLFYLDPANGWWGLSFGRSLFPGTESYYHFLFLSVLFFLVKQKWLYAAITSFVLSMSHPFAGIQLLLIIFTWVFIEKNLFKNERLPWWLPAAVLGLIGIHLFYYLYYLPSFPDHKSVSEQYSLDWHYKFYHFLPAYILVFFLFVLSIKLETVKQFISNPSNRLLLCMAVICIILSNHELFMKPMQPIHFTRGYEWTAYFFMGVPALHFILKKLKHKKWLLFFFMFFMLLDNFLWIINYVRGPRTHPITHITKEQKKVLAILDKAADINTLIIGSDEAVHYLSTVYTRGYSWISHPFTTPFYQSKLSAYNTFLYTGQTNERWNNGRTIFVFDKSSQDQLARFKKMPLSYTVLYMGEYYAVLSNK